MSTVSDRYRRCAVCHYPNLAHLATCERCKADLTLPPAATFDADVVPSAPRVIYPGLLAGAATLAGLICGTLAFVISGLVTHGGLLAYVAHLFTTPPRGRGGGPVLILSGVFVLYMLASQYAPNGRDPWLDGKQVKVGLYSTLLTTFVLAVASIAWAGTGGKTPFTWQTSFLLLPFACQLTAMAASIYAWTKLDERYGATCDFGD